MLKRKEQQLGMAAREISRKQEELVGGVGFNG